MKARPESRSKTPARDKPPIPERVWHAVHAALDRKAVDLKVLDLEGVSDFTDYFLVASGTNERQVQAVADAIRDVLRPLKVRPFNIEGYHGAHWVLMDYGDFVIHIFQEETRRFYALERLWGDAPDVTAEFASQPAPRPGP